MGIEIGHPKQRRALLERFDGKCQACGYNRCERALQFHHADSSEKGKWPGTPGRASLKEIEAHPERFVLLCANCHFERHDAIDRASHMYANCQVCGQQRRTSPSLQREGRGKYCSKKCQHAGMRRLTDDQAREMIRRYDTGTITQQRLADEYGITLMAVNKIVRQQSYRHMETTHNVGFT